jgi:hypothetical protein
MFVLQVPTPAFNTVPDILGTVYVHCHVREGATFPGEWEELSFTSQCQKHRASPCSLPNIWWKHKTIHNLGLPLREGRKTKSKVTFVTVEFMKSVNILGPRLWLLSVHSCDVQFIFNHNREAYLWLTLSKITFQYSFRINHSRFGKDSEWATKGSA